MAEMRGDFDFPTRVLFGLGRVRELGDEARRCGQHALVVTDAGVVRSGAIQPVLEALEPAVKVTVFSRVRGNPDEANVLEGLAAYRTGCDFLVAVGGGSPIDVAKAIRLLSTHPGSIREYVEIHGGTARIRPELPPLIAVPTTAGTGSEVGRSTVVTLDGRKNVVFSPYLIPTLALCDPMLTVGMPPTVTAGTGADAFIHNLEAYFSRGFHPMCDAIALEGITCATRALPTAVRDGGNLEARSDMMLAAMMGAVAFQKGLGVVHSLAHPLSSVLGAHHGTANAVMLPPALEFNRPAIASRAGAVARAMGLSGEGDQAVDAILAAVKELFAKLGLPARLGAFNVTPDIVGRLADLAMEDGCHLLNPRSVTRANMEAMYRAAL